MEEEKSLCEIHTHVFVYLEAVAAYNTHKKAEQVKKKKKLGKVIGQYKIVYPFHKYIYVMCMCCVQHK